MSTYYCLSIAAVVFLPPVTGCEKVKPTATPVPAAATRIVQGATNTPLPSTATPTPPTPTETTTPFSIATPVPTATQPTVIPTPTAAATAIEMPTPIPIPVLDASASVRTYGSRQNDSAYSVLLLADGSFLIAGQANNAGLSHRISPGNARLIRTDAEGNVLREKDYGGEVDAAFCSLVQVGEDEYVAQGYIAASYERDETDFYLVKVDGEGHEIWSQTYGGYVMTGDTHRGRVPATGEASHTGLIIKPDADSEILWRHIWRT